MKLLFVTKETIYDWTMKLWGVTYSPPSYLYDENSYTVKKASLYGNGLLDIAVKLLSLNAEKTF